MSPLRTRNAARALTLAAALLAAAPAFPAGRTEEALHLRLMHETDSAQPWRIGIYGSAPEHCQPDIERITIDGADLSIALHTPRTGCDIARSAPFLLKAVPTPESPMRAGMVYRVRVYSDRLGTPSLAAFRLLDTGSGPRMEPESGFWWSVPGDDTGPASRSTGINLEAQGDQLTVGLYGFGETGMPTWYFGNALSNGRTAVLPLLELAGGDPLFAPAGTPPAALPGPRLELEFVSPARARAWLVRNVDGYDVAVRALTLSRLRYADTPAAVGSGRWVFVADDERAPRQFEFGAPARQDAGAVRLTDPGSDAALECRGGGGDDLPQRCRLFVADVAIAEFDRVGVDRFLGRNESGAPVRLLRISSP